MNSNQTLRRLLCSLAASTACDVAHADADTHALGAPREAPLAAGVTIECEVSDDCPAPTACTTEWNAGIMHQLEQARLAGGSIDHFGHCVDTSASTHEDGAALQLDLDALTQLRDASAAWGVATAAPYHLPPASSLLLDAPLLLERTFILEGHGASLRPIDEATGAIVITAPGHDTTIRDVTITRPASDANTAIGIDVQTSEVSLSNIRVIGMGIGIRAKDPAGADGNVSLQRWYDVRVGNCDDTGIVVDGEDANASLYAGISVGCGAQEGTTGLYESSYLGSNTFIGAHFEGTDTALDLEGGGQNASTFLGTYVEGHEGISMDADSQYMTFVGGNIMLTDPDRIVYADRVGGRASRLTFRQELPDPDDPTDQHSVTVVMPDVALGVGGGAVRDMAAMEFRYQYTDCDASLACDSDGDCGPHAPMNNCHAGSCCDEIPFPAWHIDRRLGLDEDTWDLRTSRITSIDRSAFNWTSSIDGNTVTPLIKQDPLCDALTTCEP